MTSQSLVDAEQQDLNPYRGNIFQEVVRDEDGNAVEKDSLGRIKYQNIDDSEAEIRENYKQANVIDFKDDDSEFVEYNYGESSLVNDDTRVVKGGGWADRLFWLSPGARKYKQQSKGYKDIGFRCAMIRMGGAAGNDDTGGNVFKEKGSKVKRRYK